MADLFLLAVAAEGAAGHAAEHEAATALGLSAGGWWSITVLTLIAIMLYLKVPALVGGMLDRKIAGIKTMLDEAADLRKEAEALKAEYEKKLRSADKHAADVKAAAEEEAKAIVKKAKDDATSLIARRERMAEDKIAAAERAAVEELRARAADISTAAARGLIASKHDAKADKDLVDKAISQI